MCAATVALVACDKKEETLKFGMGVHISASATDATADKEGQGKATINVAVITVDADGKVVACQIDTADNTVKYTAEGKAVANDGFKTKYELGKDYNMVTYGGAAKEWFEQADAFESVVVGKTLDEIKALVAEGGKGTDAVISAGCTIAITEFVGAIEKAFANLADSNATASSTLKLGMNTNQSTKDATADANGQNQVETTVVAAAIDADGKVQVVLIELNDIYDWYYAGYYANYGGEGNYDVYDVSGWGPDYGDPQSYLDTFLPDYAGYMVKMIGLY
jgi:hypothetical protein